MQLFGIFASYNKIDNSGWWRKVEPLSIQAESEEEASRAASLLAEFIYEEMGAESLIRITGPKSGRVIGEIRRPISD